MRNDISSGNLESKPPRVSLSELQRAGLLKVGQTIYDKHKNFICTLADNDKVTDGSDELSIHKMAAKHFNKSNHNGWSYFFIQKGERFVSLDSLRYEYDKKDLWHLL